MPDKPNSDNIPTFEDVQDGLGMDAMSFMSEMLSQPGTERGRRVAA